MPDNDLKLETRFTDSHGIFPYVAIGVAVAGIIGIILTMTTGVAAWLLPMDEKYLTVLIPIAADGTEALSLQMLEHEAKGKALAIKGAVLNRTASPISGIQAVIDVRDRFGLPVETATVTVEPAELPAGGIAMFQITMMLDKDLGGYSVRFKLPDEGPFVPHKDERSEPPQLLTK